MPVARREYKVAGERTVVVFDDVLTLEARQHVYGFALEAPYRIGWPDTLQPELQQHRYLHARLSGDDINKLGLLFHLAPTPVFEQLSGMKMERAVINLSTPADVHFLHAHPEAKVLLYYANLDWRPEWYGETLFFAEDLRTIDLALPYTPGRFVLFDGGTPHTIRPQSRAAAGYRFTLALLFNPQGEQAPAAPAGSAPEPAP